MDPFIHECMNGSIGSGSNGQYAFSAPLTDSKGSERDKKSYRECTFLCFSCND